MTKFAATSFAVASVALAASLSHASVVYDSLPAAPAPGTFVGLLSLAYAANSYHEAGDKVTLAGSDRALTTVTVGLSNFATAADYPAYAANNVTVGGVVGYNLPLTVNLYTPDVYSDANVTWPTVGDLIATKTINAFIAYKPVGYTALTGFNGYYETETFDFTSLGVTLPDTFVATLAFNTQNTSQDEHVAPSGVAGPYNSLNYGLADNGPTVGTDASGTGAYLGLYQDNYPYVPFDFGGNYGTLTPAIQINAVPEPSTLAAIAGAAALLLGRRRRRV